MNLESEHSLTMRRVIHCLAVCFFGTAASVQAGILDGDVNSRSAFYLDAPSVAVERSGAAEAPFDLTSPSSAVSSSSTNSEDDAEIGTLANPLAPWLLHVARQAGSSSTGDFADSIPSPVNRIDSMYLALARLADDDLNGATPPRSPAPRPSTMEEAGDNGMSATVVSTVSVVPQPAMTPPIAWVRPDLLVTRFVPADSLEFVSPPTFGLFRPPRQS